MRLPFECLGSTPRLQQFPVEMMRFVGAAEVGGPTDRWGQEVSIRFTN